MRRSLIYFWRINLAVVLGVAVATAVLTGALIVGDSVRGSLRDLSLSRLGKIDHALVSERFFARVWSAISSVNSTLRMLYRLLVWVEQLFTRNRIRGLLAFKFRVLTIALQICLIKYCPS